jgi:hypothetical protein
MIGRMPRANKQTNPASGAARRPEASIAVWSGSVRRDHAGRVGATKPSFLTKMGHQKSGIPCSDFNHSSWNRGSKFLDIREKAEFLTADVDAMSL